MRLPRARHKGQGGGLTCELEREAVGLALHNVRPHADCLAHIRVQWRTPLRQICSETSTNSLQSAASFCQGQGLDAHARAEINFGNKNWSDFNKIIMLSWKIQVDTHGRDLQQYKCGTSCKPTRQLSDGARWLTVLTREQR